MRTTTTTTNPRLLLVPTNRYSVIEALSSTHDTSANTKTTTTPHIVTLDQFRAEFLPDVEAWLRRQRDDESCLVNGRRDYFDDILKSLVRPPIPTTLRCFPDDREAVMSELCAAIDPASLLVEKHPVLHDTIVVLPRSLALEERNIHDSDIESPFVVVDCKCGAAVLRGAHVFSPGVRAASATIKPGDAVCIYVDLDDAIQMGSKTLHRPRTLLLPPRLLRLGQGRATLWREEMFEVVDTGEPDRGKTMRKNASSGSRRTIVRRARGVAVEVSRCFLPARETKSHVALPRLPLSGLLPGRVYSQNLPSIAACHALRPAPDDLVLDMCASPGGKTSCLAMTFLSAARCGAGGVLVANDRGIAKSKEVRTLLDTFLGKSGIAENRHLDRSGLQTFVGKGDSARLLSRPLDHAAHCSEEGANDDKLSRRERLLELMMRDVKRCEEDSTILDFRAGSMDALEGCFDCVLLDAPCSALGLRPRLRHDDVTIATLETDMPRQQRDLLATAIRLARPRGGCVVYSTCTFNRCENEDVVAWALRKFAGTIRLVEAGIPHLDGAGPGMWYALDDQHRPSLGLTQEEAALVHRFSPLASSVNRPSQPGVGEEETKRNDGMGFFFAKLMRL